MPRVGDKILIRVREAMIEQGAEELDDRLYLNGESCWFGDTMFDLQGKVCTVRNVLYDGVNLAEGSYEFQEWMYRDPRMTAWKMGDKLLTHADKLLVERYYEKRGYVYSKVGTATVLTGDTREICIVPYMWTESDI